MKFAFAFGEEGLHAVFLVLGVEAEAEGAVFEGYGVLGFHVPLGVDAEFGGSDGQRGVGGDLFGEFDGAVHEVGITLIAPIRSRRGYYLVDEAYAEGFVGFDGLAGVDELLGHAHAHEACQTHGAAEAGDDAETHLGLAELGVVGAEAYVASHSELAAAAEGEAVDGSNDGAGEGLDATEHFGAFAAEGLALLGAEGSHLADIGAGHEALLAVAGDDEATVVATLEFVEILVYLVEDGGVERIEALRRRDG